MFKIRQHGIKLEFNDEFTVYLDPFNPEQLEQLTSLGDTILEIPERIDNVNDDKYTDLVKEIMKELIISIEDILGQGSMKKIFGDTPIGILHLIDIIEYMNNKREEYQANQLKQYSLERLK